MKRGTTVYAEIELLVNEYGAEEVERAVRSLNKKDIIDRIEELEGLQFKKEHGVTREQAEKLGKWIYGNVRVAHAHTIRDTDFTFPVPLSSVINSLKDGLNLHKKRINDINKNKKDKKGGSPWYII